jgi:hypothetical protein
MRRKIFEGSGCLGYYIRRKLMRCRILASIVRVVKSRRLQWAGSAAGRDSWVQNFDGEIPWKGSLEKTERKWEIMLRHVWDMKFEMFMDWSSRLWHFCSSWMVTIWEESAIFIIRLLLIVKVEKEYYKHWVLICMFVILLYLSGCQGQVSVL